MRSCSPADQIARFRTGAAWHTEDDVRGKAGAFLLGKSLELAPGAVIEWQMVAELSHRITARSSRSMSGCSSPEIQPARSPMTSARASRNSSASCPRRTRSSAARTGNAATATCRTPSSTSCAAVSRWKTTGSTATISSSMSPISIARPPTSTAPFSPPCQTCWISGNCDLGSPPLGDPNLRGSGWSTSPSRSAAATATRPARGTTSRSICSPRVVAPTSTTRATGETCSRTGRRSSSHSQNFRPG